MNKASVRPARSKCVEIDFSASADETQSSDVIAQAVATESICTLCFNFSGRAIFSTSLLDEIDRWIRLGLEIQIRNLEPHLRQVSKLDEAVRVESESYRQDALSRDRS